jgi:hypothetical protein
VWDHEWGLPAVLQAVTATEYTYGKHLVIHTGK